MAIHRSKYGPIPDDHWENEPTKPGRDPSKAYSKEFMEEFDRRTRELKAMIERERRNPMEKTGG